MSDIFREVDEDIRQEKYRRLWDRFGPWLLGVAVLIVVGTGGYRGWLYWQEQNSASAGDTFFEAVKLSEAGSFEEAAALYGELESEIGGYPALAKFRLATDLANTGKSDEALAAFDALANDSGLMEGLRNVAALRAAYIVVDTETYEAVADRVEKLTGDTGAFRAAARELLALSAWKSGDIETARQWIAALEEDEETPSDVRRRVSILGDVIRSANGAAPADSASADSEGTNQ
ncbi:tetratricopeptide repeat protein [Roseibium sp. M-1]